MMMIRTLHIDGFKSIHSETIKSTRVQPIGRGSNRVGRLLKLSNFTLGRLA